MSAGDDTRRLRATTSIDCLPKHHCRCAAVRTAAAPASLLRHGAAKRLASLQFSAAEQNRVRPRAANDHRAKMCLPRRQYSGKHRMAEKRDFRTGRAPPLPERRYSARNHAELYRGARRRGRWRGAGDWAGSRGSRL